MAKTTATHWNTLGPESSGRWTPVRGLEGSAEELTLSIDGTTGEYTRLTRFQLGTDTTPFGGKSHEYPEEVFIVSGRSTIRHSACGWKRAIMRAGRPEKSTVLSKPISGVSSSN